jgi:hypothetical protein
MTILQGVGVFLIAIGVGEFIAFRYFAKTQEGIARKIVLLNVNSVFNILVGIALVALGT